MSSDTSSASSTTSDVKTQRTGSTLMRAYNESRSLYQGLLQEQKDGLELAAINAVAKARFKLANTEFNEVKGTTSPTESCGNLFLSLWSLLRSPKEAPNPGSAHWSTQ